MDRRQALHCAFFRDFTVVEAEKIFSKLKEVSLHKGDILINQGDDAESLYILVSGKLTAFIDTDQGEQMVGEVFSGETVGEMGLLSSDKRSASVKAARKSELLMLSKEQFNELWSKQPSILLAIARRTTVRLQQTLAAISNRNKKSRLFLVPGNAKTSLIELVDHLHTSIKKSDNVRIVCYQDHEAILKENDNFDLNANFLDNDARDVNTVIYVGELDNQHWTDLCLELSDKIVVVVKSKDTPNYHMATKKILTQGAGLSLMKKELVLLHHDTKTFPLNTSKWLEKADYDRHHHICLNKPDHVARLYRFLTGKAIGLVFAGGGARSFAQIGALQALAEAGIPVDTAGGTSQGSMTAWLACSGKSIDEIKETVQLGLTEMRKGLKQYTIPLFALLSAKSIVTGLKLSTENTCIENLWKQMFCVSVDIKHKHEVIHRQGFAWEAIRASISLPAVFTPVIKGNHVYVDGGVMNNCPIDVMQNQILDHEGYVIAFEFSESETNVEYDAPTDISMTRYLLNKLRLTKYHIHLPSIGETLMRSLMTSAHNKSMANIKLADACIRLPTNEYSLLDYSDKTLDKLIAIGYQTTKEHIATDPFLQQLVADLHPQQKNNLNKAG